jgi:DeoR/GlpR family transcriptional regulator of sugar metabolism
MADHTKFRQVILSNFGSIEAARIRVTDPAAPRAFLTRIRQRGVEVMGVGRRGR